jgi:glycosyltransferase involved in cell wall biosynthesis
MSNNVPNIFVSVIVPVVNDGKRLQICLEALAKQTYPQELYEVIVVDNASDITDNIKDIVVQFNQLVIAYEVIPSSYAASNRGISITKREAICFTDSDSLDLFFPSETQLSFFSSSQCISIMNLQKQIQKLDLF